MKKVGALSLSLLFCLLLFSACGGSSASPAPASTPAQQAPQSQAPAQIEQPAGEELYSLDFELINFSNAALTDIRISHSSEDNYGENLLEPGYVLPDGYSVPISFNDGAPADTTYDMYTEDEDGDIYHYFDIPLTKIRELTLRVVVYSDGSYNNEYEYK